MSSSPCMVCSCLVYSRPYISQSVMGAICWLSNHSSGPYNHHAIHLHVLLKSGLLLFAGSLRLFCFHRASGKRSSEKMEIWRSGFHLGRRRYNCQEVLFYTDSNVMDCWHIMKNQNRLLFHLLFFCLSVFWKD